MKMNRRALVVFHRWLGLIAGAWLLTLGVTGIFWTMMNGAGYAKPRYRRTGYRHQ